MTAPRKPPEPLPELWLKARKARECRWEIRGRADEERLREIQEWAKAELTELYVAQELGGNHSDPDFVNKLNSLYDRIRDALTRQDLILGFLTTIQRDAQLDANATLESFQRDLKDITGI